MHIDNHVWTQNMRTTWALTPLKSQAHYFTMKATPWSTLFHNEDYTLKHTISPWRLHPEAHYFTEKATPWSTLFHNEDYTLKHTISQRRLHPEAHYFTMKATPWSTLFHNEGYTLKHTISQRRLHPGPGCVATHWHQQEHQGITIMLSCAAQVIWGLSLGMTLASPLRLFSLE